MRRDHDSRPAFAVALLSLAASSGFAIMQCGSTAAEALLSGAPTVIDEVRAVEDLIPLPQMLARLRNDLLEARAEGEGKDLHFLVDDIELELQMAITQDQEGGVGIKFWVLNAQAEEKSVAATTQRLKLRLKVQGPEGSFAISRSRPGLPK